MPAVRVGPRAVTAGYDISNGVLSQSRRTTALPSSSANRSRPESLHYDHFHLSHCVATNEWFTFRKLPEILLCILLGRILFLMRNSTFWAKLLSFLQNCLEDHSKKILQLHFLVKENSFSWPLNIFACIMRILHRFYTWVDNFNNPYLYCRRSKHLANLSRQYSA